MRTKLASLLTVLVASMPAQAGLVTLDHIDRGFYRENGLHLPFNELYVAGFFEVEDFTEKDHRNWFLFDLSALSETVISAQLKLEQPTSGFGGSPGTFSLYDVETDLTSLQNGTGGVDAFDDLGTGIFYGDAAIDESTNGTFVTIDLNAEALNAINNGAGLLAFGGTYSPESTQAGNFTFGRSGGTETILQLNVNPIPEPSLIYPLALAGLAGIAFLSRRKKTRKT